jgi:large subunit ribosomal protein L15
MRLTDVKPKAGSKRRKKRIGRGIAAGQGASGGFGMRGQKSRSGRPTRPGFEGGQMPLYAYRSSSISPLSTARSTPLLT